MTAVGGGGDTQPQTGRDERAYGSSPQARANVVCECGHTPSYHEGDEFGFCLVCECNHYLPTVKGVNP